MITATPFTVTNGASVNLGTFTNATVIVSNQNAAASILYLGTTSAVTASNGFPIPGSSAPLNLGRVTGTLWAIGSAASIVIGVLVTTPN
jgi:hypothetical protein